MNIIKARAWLAATALGAALPVGAAMAADLLVKAKPVVAATFDWSGVYIGAHAGYGGGMKDWSPTGTQADFVARGALAGGQIGINKQLGSLVFGGELAGSWTDINGKSHLEIGGPALASSVAIDHASGIDGIATVAGRAGLAADRWFVFAKAGLSAAHEKHSFSMLVTGVPGSFTVASGNEVRYAPMLGFGSEYALGGNWSLFGEYNLHLFGDRSVSLRGTSTAAALAGPLAFDQSIDQSIHVAKVGVNYRWGGVAVDPSYPAVRPVPGNDWTGGYIGVQGGYGWGSTQWGDGFGAPNPDFRTDGWLAGGTIGANAQAGSFVFGVEGEILGTGIKGSLSATGPGPGVATQTSILNSRIDWLALATARAGFVAGSNLLLYGKGGVAIAQEAHTLDLSTTGPTTAASLSGKAIHSGVVAGAGAEYAFAPNWSVKAEYDYVRMFGQAVTMTGTAAGGLFGAGVTLVAPINKVGQDLHLVKFGVNYHFNPLPSVVAKY
ncbi:outer membrane protein [Bradyrhizobium sp.]|uniref:outer membrane protein n=1 Tax=Bradyrhizobium sp. TaxID=376 RepID=UPI0040377593